MTVTLYRVFDTSYDDFTPKLWSVDAKDLPKTYRLLGRCHGFNGIRILDKNEMSMRHQRVATSGEEAIELWRNHVQSLVEQHEWMAARMVELLSKGPTT